MKNMIYAPSTGAGQTVHVEIVSATETLSRTYVDSTTSFAIHDMLTLSTYEPGGYSINVTVSEWEWKGC